MGIFGRRGGVERLTVDQCHDRAQQELANWHLRHPLHTFRVYYANDAGNEKVVAHRYILEQVGDVAVFMFEVVTPEVDAYEPFSIDTTGLAVLTVPFERVHSINLELEADHGTSAAA